MTYSTPLSSTLATSSMAAGNDGPSRLLRNKKRYSKVTSTSVVQRIGRLNSARVNLGYTDPTPSRCSPSKDGKGGVGGTQQGEREKKSKRELRLTK